MKLQELPDIDTNLAVAIHHEFLRCQESFDEFHDYALSMIMLAKKGQTDRRLAFRTYNAYSRFVHHLYEFLIGATQRDIQSTNRILAEDAEKHITGYLQRVLNRRRKAIINGTAPTWENHISYYPEIAPTGLAREFRLFRNKINGHVSYERPNLNLSDFYNRNHKFLHMLYYDCLGFWGEREGEFPDLKEITDFSVLLIREKSQEK